VTKETNKIEIKRAVESNYNVEVTGVRIINIPRRKVRVGKNEGWKKGYKKAIVEVKKGQSIEILPR
jgi:large subunit ribosomal protein L23